MHSWRDSGSGPAQVADEDDGFGPEIGCDPRRQSNPVGQSNPAGQSNSVLDDPGPGTSSSPGMTHLAAVVNTVGSNGETEPRVTALPIPSLEATAPGSFDPAVAPHPEHRQRFVDGGQRPGPRFTKAEHGVSIRSRAQGWMVPLVVVAGVAGLLTLSVVVALSRLNSPGSHPGHNDAAEVPMAWDPMLEPYVRFVAESRGLEFVHPVKLEFRDIEESLKDSAAVELRDFDEDTIDYYERWGMVTTILGLTLPGENPFEIQADVRSAGAAAFYELTNEVIVLPSGETGVDIQLSIVHELTHALQHQNGLFEGQPLTADQSAMGLALAEGDASRIEALWYAQMSQAEKETLLAEGQARQDGAPSVSGYYVVNFAAPYILGEPIISILIADGDTERLDHELAEARLSTELLIDPLTTTPYPNEIDQLEPGVSVPPKATFELSGTLGPLMLFQTLEPGLGPQQAVDALKGYDSDDFSLWSDSRKTCLDIQVVFDRGTEAKEFVALARALFGEPTSLAGVSSSSRAVQYRICDDQSIGSPQDQNLEMLYPVALNNYLVALLRSEGYEDHVSSCGAAGVALATDVAIDPAPDYEEIVVQARHLAESTECQEN